MLAALALCCATVLAAAAPGVALGVGDLNSAGDRLAGAELAARAAELAQTLADERDDLAVRAAGGHGSDASGDGAGLAAGDRARADREVRDVVAAGASADLRAALAGLSAARRTALAGNGGPQGVVAAYRPLVAALERLAGPATAAPARAADAAAVQRALLVAALTAGGAQGRLVSAAQSAHLQEEAALATFRGTASPDLLARYDRTVTGPDAAQADRDLRTLLDGYTLDRADRALHPAAVDAALTARIGLMRSVVSSAAADDVRSAGGHRHHTVTVLELRAALALLCLLLIIAVLVNLFRGISRPLAGLHRWARSESDSGQGAQVAGSDEFAAIARRANALTHEVQALRDRVHELTAERTAAAERTGALTAERDELLRTRQDLMRSREEIAARLKSATAQNAAHITFVNLSLRTLGLVERQLALIDSLEDREQDPDRLATLFRLDHLATRMRRNSENLLVLTGTEHAHGATVRPVPLVDVARAAVSEIERYERVVVEGLPEAQVAGRAADDVSHLIAELLDNAAAFSEPTAEVQVTGWLMDGGEVMLSVADTGIGVPDERLDELNELLADADPAPPGAVSGMGLYVVARLAHRHGVRVQLRPQPGGGTSAVVVLPQLLLPAVGPGTTSGRYPFAAPVADPAAPPTPADASASAAPFAEPEPVPAGHPAAEAAPPIPSAPLPVQGTAASPAGRPGPAGSPSGPDGNAYGDPGPQPHPVHDGDPVRMGDVAPAPLPVRTADTAHTGAHSGPVAYEAGPAHDMGATRDSGAVRESDVAPAADDTLGGRTSLSGTGVQPLTGKGLPQRVPRSTGLNGEPIVRPAPRAARGPVDAEELRRRLGGLQRGLHAGRRDAEHEISTGTGPVAGGEAAAARARAQAPVAPEGPQGDAGESAPPRSGATEEATR